VLKAKSDSVNIISNRIHSYLNISSLHYILITLYPQPLCQLYPFPV